MTVSALIESSVGAAARRAERAAHRMARMEAFEVDGLEASRSAAGALYHEFLRRDSMSAGLYVLRTREDDPQTPHGQDELYYVISGRGRFRVGGHDRPVGPGTILFVEAGVEHRFHTITQDISVLVVFAPPEE
jgi:mannose-6-phosphate isomerase-like protein (cupin superfamily)